MAAMVIALALVAPMVPGMGRVPAAVAQTLTTEQTAALEEATRLNEQVVQLLHQGQYAEAIPLAQQALDILETTLGGNHPDVATVLNGQSRMNKP
jgi:hypothetical protein